MKSRYKEFVFWTILYFLSFMLTMGLLEVIDAKIFIPLVSYLIIAIAVLGSISVQIFIIVKWVKSDNKKLIKALLAIGLIVITFIFILYLFISSLFLYYPNNPFQHNGKTYYYMDTGWLDPYYEIYKKDGMLTMSKLSYEDVEKVFINSGVISDEGARNFINIMTRKDINFEESNIKAEYQKNILEKTSIESAKIIDESTLALAEVDRAAARSLWYFVKIIDDKMEFISEIPDNSPTIEAKIDSEGTIYLECKDINGNINKYKSTDGGKNWIKI